MDRNPAGSTKDLLLRRNLYKNLHFIRAVLQSVNPSGTGSMSAISQQVAESYGSNERAGLSMSLKAATLNSAEVKTGQLTLKRILSVRCPVCRAKAKEQCTFTTGHPSIKTHIKRAAAAAEAPSPENSGQVALRSLRGFATRGFRTLFHPKQGDNASKTE
jgi:hypothetical protein